MRSRAGANPEDRVRTFAPTGTTRWSPRGGRTETDGVHDDLPPGSTGFTAVNAEFFGDAVTGWGEAGGPSPDFRTDQDHPVVAARRPGGD